MLERGENHFCAIRRSFQDFLRVFQKGTAWCLAAFRESRMIQRTVLFTMTKTLRQGENAALAKRKSKNSGVDEYIATVVPAPIPNYLNPYIEEEIYTIINIH